MTYLIGELIQSVAISVAAQGVVDAQMPDGRRVPASLMTLIIAGSGERKTSVENILFKPIRAFQLEKREACEREMVEYRAVKKAHDYRLNKLSREMAKQSKASVGYMEQLKELRSDARAEPAPPREYKILYQNASIEALLQGMAFDFKSVGLVSSEGAAILKSRAFNSFSSINSLWSGEDVESSRIVSGNRLVSNGRLTALIMAQHEAVNEFIEAKGDTSRGVGLWARFLVFKPRSTQGGRFISGRSAGNEAAILSWYEGRINQALDDSISLSIHGSRRHVIALSHDACELVVELHNRIEKNISPGGFYELAGDHASKLIENIVRVSVILSHFENGFDEVSAGILKAAAHIVGASSACFMDYFPHSTPAIDSAQLLLTWLKERETILAIKKKDILQSGPFRLRSARKLDPVLRYLEEKGCVRVLNHGLSVLIALTANADLPHRQSNPLAIRAIFSF